jgi:hypothetical protein
VVFDLVAALQSTATILPTMNSILANIKPKQEVKAEELEALKRDFGGVLEKLEKVGLMGSLLDDYTKYYLGSYIVYMTSDKLSEQINRYRTELEKNDATYWEIIENSFKDVRKGRSDFLNIILNRVDYLHEKDSIQISLKVQDLNDFYIKAQTYFDMKKTDEFKRCINDMSDVSLELYNMFKSSIGNMTFAIMCLKRS